MALALYRRYRPDTFEGVIGQDQVTVPLMRALDEGKLTHAYLFSGPRGCGKTSSARILARCINCVNGPTSHPCGECESCKDLATGGPGSIDVVEIDAASHNGVDDARELRERAGFAPARDRYKIFILDEAHMVTQQGFNALLKIVEEPPEHVMFIFATTEPDKVIGTIRSRTHHYPFRLVPQEVMGPYLEQICGKEGVKPEPGVLKLAMRAGGGSMRDTLSVLDQLMVGSAEGVITHDAAVALLGFTPEALIGEAIDAVIDHNGEALYGIIQKVVVGGFDPRRFVEDLLARVRDLLVLTLAGDRAESVLSDTAETEDMGDLHRQAKALGLGALTVIADIINTTLGAMTGAISPRMRLELLAARLLAGSESGFAAFPVTPAAAGGAPAGGNMVGGSSRSGGPATHAASSGSSANAAAGGFVGASRGGFAGAPHGGAPNAQSGVAQSGAVRSDAGRPSSVQSDAARSGVAQPGSAPSGFAQPDTAWPVQSQPVQPQPGSMPTRPADPSRHEGGATEEHRADMGRNPSNVSNVANVSNAANGSNVADVRPAGTQDAGDAPAVPDTRSVDDKWNAAVASLPADIRAYVSRDKVPTVSFGPNRKGVPCLSMTFDKPLSQYAFALAVDADSNKKASAVVMDAVRKEFGADASIAPTSTTADGERVESVRRMNPEALGKVKQQIAMAKAGLAASNLGAELGMHMGSEPKTQKSAAAGRSSDADDIHRAADASADATAPSNQFGRPAAAQPNGWSDDDPWAKPRDDAAYDAAGDAAIGDDAAAHTAEDHGSHSAPGHGSASSSEEQHPSEEHHRKHVAIPDVSDGIDPWSVPTKPADASSGQRRAAPDETSAADPWNQPQGRQSTSDNPGTRPSARDQASAQGRPTPGTQPSGNQPSNDPWNQPEPDRAKPQVAAEDDVYSMNDQSLGEARAMDLNELGRMFEVKKIEDFAADDPKNPKNIQPREKARGR
jgi:DNA polymerase-3 subunit gamma/tau